MVMGLGLGSPDRDGTGRPLFTRFLLEPLVLVYWEYVLVLFFPIYNIETSKIEP